MARQFGIITNTSGVTSKLIANSVTKSSSVEKAEARNSVGQVIDQQAYSKSDSYNIRGLLDAEAPDVEAGDKITLGGVDYLVDSAEIVESNTAFVEWSISCSRADAATIHPLVTSGGVTSGGTVGN